MTAALTSSVITKSCENFKSWPFSFFELRHKRTTLSKQKHVQLFDCNQKYANSFVIYIKRPGRELLVKKANALGVVRNLNATCNSLVISTPRIAKNGSDWLCTPIVMSQQREIFHGKFHNYKKISISEKQSTFEDYLKDR